ncbi:MAG: hypothetical protein KBD63_06155 [Bacteriovoracaceae bacterium]|nr:hypothetical protein [Bacteriovoracaceae bacterium]
MNTFYAHGKLLLTGEYVVIDGAKALAIPLKKGQSLHVRELETKQGKIFLQAKKENDEAWLSYEIDYKKKPTNTDDKICHIIFNAQKLNPTFLKESRDYQVETKLEFSPEFGWGSSATLYALISQWAQVSALDLFFSLEEGSGYDVACALSQESIIYQKQENPHWEKAFFDPLFKEHLYFLYLGKKEKTEKAINEYKNKITRSEEVVRVISQLTVDMIKTKQLQNFESLIKIHEEIMSAYLKKTKIKEKFSSFWGEMKSLGAWGGDFALVTSLRSFTETQSFFKQHGLQILLPYSEVAL